MTTNYHTPIPSSPKQPANAATINAPLAEIDQALTEALLAERDGHIIQEEGVDLAQQPRLDFVGNAVVVTNGSGKTTVTINEVNNLTVGGRLTLQSGVPISSSDQTAKTTVYFTPYTGNVISLYYNSKWLAFTFIELSLPLSGYTANKIYDIFAYYNGSAVVLESLVWTNDSTRGTALTTQNGVPVMSGFPTRRYLGKIRITGTTGQCEDSIAKRFVQNYYNRVDQSMKVTSSTGHTNTNTAIAYWNSDSSMKLEFLSDAEDQIFVTCLQDTLFAAACSSSQGCVGLGLNTIATLNAVGYFGAVIQGRVSNAIAFVPTLGYNYVAVLERGLTGVTFNVGQASMMVRG